MGRRKFEALNADSPEVLDMRTEGPGVCDHKLIHAARIKTLRKAAGVSAAELAARLGLTPSAVMNWEAGRSSPTSAIFPRCAAR